MQDILIARQPIFNRNYELSAYELIFRNNEATINQDEHMTAQVITTALMDIGLEKISNNQPVNINASASILLSNLEFMSSLPPEKVAIELLEDIPVNSKTIKACKSLKDQGFTIILDDTLYAPQLKPMFELADMIKVDLTRVDNLVEEVRALRKHPIKILAYNVETYEQYEQIKVLNFDFAQGHFFSKPEIIEGRKLPESKLATMQALQKVMSAEAVSDVHDIVKQDVSLSYRLLKYINSVSFGMKRKVESIEQALALLGLKNIQQWLSLLSMAALGEHKSTELIKVALIRGHFLESIAKHSKEPEVGNDFLLGMFSVLDALLDTEMKQALEDIHLPTDVREGLLDPSSQMGRKLMMCKALEDGDWHLVQEWSASGKSICIADITRFNIEALSWADSQVPALE